jgi:16S rRNA (uracil1498-N3)-methyltransferase
MPFQQFIEQVTAIQKLIAHCEPLNKTSIKSIETSEDLVLLIGPEGDFTPSEIEAAISKNFTPIDLGPTRLRTETAGIFALSVLKNF